MRADNDVQRPASGGKAVLSFLFWSVVFGVSYTQPRLYYSNQNQYFLHGLARAGRGFLQEDWLANTADPTPVFTALVAFTAAFLSEYTFYIYYILILGAYFHALLGIFKALHGQQANGAARLRFLALIVASHSALFRWSSAQVFGVDYPWYLQTGVANQYILGAGLQPSVFGVLLLVSILAFLRDRPITAAIWAALGAVMHATYLLSAAFLTLAYLYCLYREKRVRLAFFTGLTALALVMPIVIYDLLSFAPSSATAFAQSQHLLAHFRLPHHAEPQRWLDGIACAQIALIPAAVIVARHARLRAILFIPFLLSVALSLVQVATDNDTLALLFPWRTSALLIPVATAVLLTRLVEWVPTWYRGSIASSWWLKGVCAMVIAICVIGGTAISYFDLGYRTNDRELPLLRYVRDHKAAGEVYLLPVEVPKLKSGRSGAASLNFTAPPRRAEQSRVISVDLQRFRLFCGAPIFVDFKSIPYKDMDVLEWHRRLSWNEEMYQSRDWSDDDVLRRLDREGITHVVITADKELQNESLELIYKDDSYRLYRLQRRQPSRDR